MTAAEWEVRRLLADPGIRTAVRAWVDAARRDYVVMTAKAEREIAAHDPSPYCQWCEQQFEREYWNQAYCTNKCRKKASEKRWRDTKAAWQRRKRAEVAA